MDYSQAWEFLDQLQFFKIKLGLDSMNEFLTRLGNPHLELPCIHIGGTNGKGSVGATLCSILSAAGYRVGFYTSPHLSSVRERFRINDKYIAKADFARLMQKIENVLNGGQITYFECTTTLAMLWFAEQQVDFAILEVGMGGRLDATNVVTPLLSIITNVSMDHEQYLGTTLREVATEKAGIIKENVPLVSGVATDDSGEVIEQTCREKNAPLFLLGRDFTAAREGDSSDRWQYRGMDGFTSHDLPLAMQGSYQVANASLAVAAVQLLRKNYRIDEEQIRTGLARTRWPGRLEYFSLPGRSGGSGGRELRYLLDGAHNPAGVSALQRALADDFMFRKLILVWGAMEDKDLQTTLRRIAPLADTILFTRPESERSATPEQLRQALGEQTGSTLLQAPTVAAALEQAAELAEPDDLICVAGSLYLVGAAREILRGALIDG
jgi:dihydrofolate synthase/folylpolyglutamate synthase